MDLHRRHIVNVEDYTNIPYRTFALKKSVVSLGRYIIIDNIELGTTK